MLLALLLASVGAQVSDTRTVSLYLGSVISDGFGGTYRYESVEDTTLDREQPDKNEGGEFSLGGGRDKTILIRFGDLERALGPFRHIKKATLYLTADSTKPELSSIAKVMVPWGEGPLLVVGKPFIKAAGPGALPAPAFSATWKDRRAGTSWSLGGARSESDAQIIAGAKLTTTEDQVAITDLSGAVQDMADHPSQNFGFALAFAAPSEFESSQAPKNRPRLELEVEKAAIPAGADLSVTRIDRTPTYDVSGPKTAPAKSEEVTYTAHIRNVGDASSKFFLARWSVDDRPGSALEIDKALAPGEEATVTLKQAYEPLATDHRGGKISCTVTTNGPDADARNNAVTTYSNARAIGLTVEASFAKEIEANSGYRRIDDWAQAQMRVLNETYLPHSRFSFAPDGGLERFRLQGIQVVPDGTSKDQRAGEDLDGVVRFSTEDSGLRGGQLSQEFVRRLGFALGLPNLGTMNVSYERGKGQTARASSDRFGGVMGGGDTRFDGSIPGFFVLPYEPYSNPIFDVVATEPTELFAATDVFAMNSSLGTRGAFKSALTDMPTAVVIKAVGLDGKPLSGAELSFFQTKAGRIDDGAPAFTVVTDSGGTVNLPNRPGGTKDNPFGAIDPAGSNGLFMIRAAANGVTDYGWLKAWQLADAFHRTGRPAPIFELRFSLPSQPLDSATNLADGRPVRDSANDLPAKLASLVDGQTNGEVALPGEKDAWIEVDLGRDRPVGEVQLVVNSTTFWQQFDIVGYATGQEATGLEPWTKELDWGWTNQARGDRDANGAIVVHYRGTAARFRYIRIVNRGLSSPASLAELRVIPVRG